MKRFIYLMAMLAAFSVYAAQDMVPLKVTNPLKNGEGTSTNTFSAKVGNFIEGVIINVTNITPVVSTGATLPASANGYFDESGTYSGQTYYVSQNGSWYLWYDGVVSNYITGTVGSKTLGWALETNGVSASVVTGDYSTVGLSTGAIHLASTAANVDLKVYVTDGGSLGAERTVLANTNISANGYYPIRINDMATTGTNLVGELNSKIPLYDDYLRLEVKNAWYSNVVVKALVILIGNP
jgi:hypothetical protein